MALVTLSNPPPGGLDLAILGNPGRRKRMRYPNPFSARYSQHGRTREATVSSRKAAKRELEGMYGPGVRVLGVYDTPGKKRRSVAAKKGAATRKRKAAASKRRKPVPKKAAKRTVKKTVKRTAVKRPVKRTTKAKAPSRGKVIRVGRAKARITMKKRKGAAVPISKTKRKAAARKAARTRAAKKQKRVLAGKKSWRTRKRRGTTKAKTKRRVSRKARKSTYKRRARKSTKRRTGRSRVGRTYRLKSYGKRRVKIRGEKRRRRGAKRKAYGKRSRGMKWTGRRGTKTYRAQVWRKGKRGSRRVYFSNAGGKKRRRGRRRARRNMRFRNPSLGGYLPTLFAQPKAAMAALRGRNMVKDTLYISGGAVATYLAGGLVGKGLAALGDRVGFVGQVLANPIGQRVIAGALPYTIGYFGSSFVKSADLKRALITGGAVASIVSFIAPNAMDKLLTKLGISQYVPAAVKSDTPPVEAGTEGLGAYQMLAGQTMLAGYVEAPSYAGTEGGDELAGYVEAPSYAGTEGMGGYMDNSYLNSSYLAGYVEAPSYAGAG